MGKSGGEHVWPVPNCAAAFVYEFQFLKKCTKETETERDSLHESVAFFKRVGSINRDPPCILRL